MKRLTTSNWVIIVLSQGQGWHVCTASCSTYMTSFRDARTSCPCQAHSVGDGFNPPSWRSSGRPCRRCCLEGRCQPRSLMTLRRNDLTNLVLLVCPLVLRFKCKWFETKTHGGSQPLGYAERRNKEDAVTLVSSPRSLWD